MTRAPLRPTDLRRALPVFAFVIVMLGLQIFRSLDAAAAEPWDDTDKVLGAIAVTAAVVDWGQTRYLVKNPCANLPGAETCTDPYHERNPLLGDHPSLAKVDRYFVGGLVVGGLVAHYLPSSQRKWFLGAVAIVEISVAMRNCSIGIGFTF